LILLEFQGFSYFHKKVMTLSLTCEFK